MRKYIHVVLNSLLAVSIISCSKINTTDWNWSNWGGLGGPAPGKVNISEVKSYSSLTLTNNSFVTENLENWKLVEVRKPLTGGTFTNEFIIPAGTVINVNATVAYSASTLGFILGSDETIYLYDNRGMLITQMSWMSFKW